MTPNASPNRFVRRRQNMAALSFQAGTRRRGIQIGPRIRVGGTLGKIGQSVKEGVGSVAKKAAPFAALIPGVGPLAAGALGAAGTILDTSHGGVSLGDIAKGGLTSGGLGMLSKIPGVSSLGSSVLSHIPGASALGDQLKKIPGVSSLAGSAGDFLKTHGDELLQGAGALTSALDAKNARDLENKALGIANGTWESRSGLREMGVNGLLNSAPPDLSALYDDPGNVYSRKKVKGVSQGVAS